MNWFTSFLRRPPIGWWDLLDILVVSILIYEVLKLIRGTRAVQMALGGGVLVGAALRIALGTPRNRQLADSQHDRLHRVRGHRAVSVRHPARARAFRPRAVLPLLREGRVGRPSRSRSWSSPPACSRRSASARSSRSSGRSACATTSRAVSALDAVLTYDLLQSIFLPQSPLHDGAVIVQDDRVAAAACFLPLTVNPKLSKELGSRHRAAIGLTEENDSVAIVVSEETGNISIVVDGQIERGLTRDELRDAAAIAGAAAAREDAAEARGRVHVTFSKRLVTWPFRHFWLEGAVARAGAAALDGRVGRGDCRTRAARAARAAAGAGRASSCSAMCRRPWTSACAARRARSAASARAT